MSERKTAEIKFRVAPSNKARWQAEAAAEDISLSQFIEEAVQNHLWAKQNKSLDGTKLVDSAIGALETPVIAYDELTPEEQKGASDIVESALERREYDKVERHSWMFEGRNG